MAPHAWDYAPIRTDLTPQTSKTLFKFQKVKLFEVKIFYLRFELNIHPGEWITITGKMGLAKLPYSNL